MHLKISIPLTHIYVIRPKCIHPIWIWVNSNYVLRVPKCMFVWFLKRHFCYPISKPNLFWPHRLFKCTDRSFYINSKLLICFRRQTRLWAELRKHICYSLFLYLCRMETSLGIDLLLSNNIYVKHTPRVDISTRNPAGYSLVLLEVPVIYICVIWIKNDESWHLPKDKIHI